LEFILKSAKIKWGCSKTSVFEQLPRKNNRVVQKPQFLNNFPEKNRGFAAICGKSSRTWERTARFLNKSNLGVL
jgi:hypothetical protein